jgi:hypothetical protein
MTRPLLALSLGGGRQSSVLALMSAAGELPHLDVAVFADTQHETGATYRWLDNVIAPELTRAGIELIRVTHGNLLQDHLDATDRVSQIPAFIANAETGERGRIMRRCSRDYKVRPVRRASRAAMAARGLDCIEQWVGFAHEETGRLKDEVTPRYLTTRYPLMELQISSAGCAAWLADHGYPPAPRSACYFCPHARDPRWLELRRQAPDEFARAVQFDQELRARGIPGIDGTVYLHESLRPLDVAVEAADAQGTLFDTDCTDGCMT